MIHDDDNKNNDIKYAFAIPEIAKLNLKKPEIRGG